MIADVWVTFRQALPTSVFLSEEAARKHRLHSETVEHFIHINGSATSTREGQLERANELLREQIEDLTAQLGRAEKRMTLLERISGVPVLMRLARRRHVAG